MFSFAQFDMNNRLLAYCKTQIKSFKHFLFYYNIIESSGVCFSYDISSNAYASHGKIRHINRAEEEKVFFSQKDHLYRIIKIYFSSNALVFINKSSHFIEREIE